MSPAAKPGMQMLSPHFSRSEFACKCCGGCVVDPRLIDALEKLRALGEEPIQVDCGCRCSKHNAQVPMSATHSVHLFDPKAGIQTRAADIRIEGLTRQQMYERAIQIEDFWHGGIGLYDSDPAFIHVDVRENGPARWARVAGKYVGISELLSE